MMILLKRTCLVLLLHPVLLKAASSLTVLWLTSSITRYTNSFCAGAGDSGSSMLSSVDLSEFERDDLCNSPNASFCCVIAGGGIGGLVRFLASSVGWPFIAKP